MCPVEDMMPKQRLLTTLKGVQPDRVPILEFPFNLDLYETFLGYRPQTYNGRDATRLAMKIGLDGVVVFDSPAHSYQPEWVHTQRYMDEWGVTFQTDPASWPLDAPVVAAVEGTAELLGYQGPDPWAPGRTRDVEAALEEAKGRIAVVGCIDGPFMRPWFIAGFERFMLLCHDAPEVVQHLVQVCTDFAIITGKRLAQAGADALLIADDLGHKTGPFLSLEHFRCYILPPLRREVCELKKLGVPILLHSDGDINSYLEDLVDTGIDGLNPLQRTANMDLATVKRLYGDRISLVGNIDASRTLPYGTAAQIEQEVIEALRVAAPGGRYVLSTDHSLHGGIPVQNIITMIETAYRFGRYPLNLPEGRT
jgi:uroporphyrinogen decarboxylase